MPFGLKYISLFLLFAYLHTTQIWTLVYFSSSVHLVPLVSHFISPVPFPHSSRNVSSTYSLFPRHFLLIYAPHYLTPSRTFSYIILKSSFFHPCLSAIFSSPYISPFIPLFLPLFFLLLSTSLIYWLPLEQFMLVSAKFCLY